MGGIKSLGAWAGWWLVVGVIAWLPGQLRAGALRAWFVSGLWPLLVFGALLKSGVGVPRWALGGVALTLWGLLGVAFCIDPGAVLEGSLGMWGLLGGFVLGLSMGERDAIALSRASWIGGALAALPAFWLPDGTFGNPDWLANLLVLTILWGGYALAPRLCPARGFVVGASLSLALQIAALVALGSLGAYAALVIGACAGVCVYLRRIQRPWLAVALLSSVLASVVALSLLHPDVQAHIQGRFYIARITWAVITDAAPWGVGVGHFHSAFLAAQADLLTDAPAYLPLWTDIHHAHNELFQALAVLGVPGLLVLLPVVLALSRGHTQTHEHTPKHTPKHAHTQGDSGWQATVAMCVLGLVSMPLYEPLCGWLAAVSVGWCLRSPSLPPEPNPPKNKTFTPTKILALSLCVCALALSTSQYAGDRLLAHGSATQNRDQIQAASHLLLQRSTADLLGVALGLSQGAGPAERPWAERAVRLDPSPISWWLLGRVALAQGDLDTAIAAFQRAIHLHPRLFVAYLYLARAYLSRGDLPAARRCAERAHSLRPSDPRLRLISEIP